MAQVVLPIPKSEPSRSTHAQSTRANHVLGGIRVMNPLKHGPALVRLFDEGFSRAQTRLADGNTLARTSALDLASIERHTGFVWQTPEGQIIGAVAILSHPSRRDTAIIANVVTDKRYRGRGVGRNLLQAAVTFARKQRLIYMALQVDKDNESAVRLYESLGFEHLGEVGYHAARAEIHSPHPISGANLIAVRRAVASDTKDIQRLSRLSIPEALTYADSVNVNHLVSRIRNTSWVAERCGRLLGAITMDHEQHANDQWLMLDPRCTPVQSQGLLHAVLSHVSQESQTQLVFVQSCHALNTLQTLTRAGFTLRKSTMHMRLTIA